MPIRDMTFSVVPVSHNVNSTPIMPGDKASKMISGSIIDRNCATVVSREMLAQDVWKETDRATPIDNVIDVHIARLRRKIDDGCERKLLHTVRGVGFILREEPQ